MSYNQIIPADSLTGARITIQNQYGTTVVPFHFQDTTNKQGWLLLLPTGDLINKIRYPDFPAVSDVSYSSTVSDIEVSNMYLI